MFIRKVGIKMNEFEKKLTMIEKEAPDGFDLAMLKKAKAENDGTNYSFEDIEEMREYNGVLSIRVPKELHRALVLHAKENGVSLNQYVMYCLAKSNANV